MNCNHKGCSSPATHEAVLELRAHSHHPPAESTPVVFVCAQHRDVEWSDVVTAKGWAQICSAFDALGRARPVEKHSNIKVRKITPPS